LVGKANIGANGRITRIKLQLIRILLVVTTSSNPKNLEQSLIFRIETKSQNRNSVFLRTKPKTEFSIPFMCEWNWNGEDRSFDRSKAAMVRQSRGAEL
jgi:hypothetical protein